ncbi:hypothetical protein cypCar_00038430, partial [Cyprinus carpio]
LFSLCVGQICKGQAPDSKQAHLYSLSVQQSIPSHFNLQQDCGHFIACVPRSMLPSEESGPAEQERVVVITRDVPHQSVADFVREWESFHRAQPEVYERRVCFLLLQLCAGLEHLKAHGVTHRDLCMENLLLLQRPDPQQHSLPRLLISSFAKAKRRDADQYHKFDEFQTGILIYELLHRRNPFEATPGKCDYRCDELPPIPAASIYSPGLQRLAHLLLEPDPGRRIHIQDARRILQVVSISISYFQCAAVGAAEGAAGAAVGVWRSRGWRRRVEAGAQARRAAELLLDVKRALLMMKFASARWSRRGRPSWRTGSAVIDSQRANPRSLCQTAELLYSLRFTH